LGLEPILFYVFAAVAVTASVLVVGQRSPIYSVVLLIGSFVALAGLYVLLDAPFVAVIQIIIYAGAILVLFLFVVMLLNAGAEARAPHRALTASRWMGIGLAVALVAELGWALWRAMGDDLVATGPGGEHVSSVRAIGVALFTDYAFAFEVTSLLILVAMVGAVVLAKRNV
jgi:NADH-quinone oxidoreductase subunit J